MLRVTGGNYRGTLLYCPPNIRPTSGRIKEYIFSQVGQFTIGASVLDLFAGSGALGIEALSRRAGKAVFVDKSRRACQAVYKNLNKLGIEAKVSHIDALKFIRYYKSEPFNLIFIDPPYDEFHPETIIKAIEEVEILNEGGHLIYELKAGQQEPETTSLLLTSFRTLSDTTVGIWFRK